MTRLATTAATDRLDRLADLRRHGPRILLPGTLLATGLADAYATLDSPAGPVFVAWNTPRRLDGRPGRRPGRVRGAVRPTRPVARLLRVDGVPPRLARASSGAPGGRPSGAACPSTCAAAPPFEAARPAQGARDPARRGPAVRLDRRRDRPPEGGPRGRHRARPQPDPADHPVPSRGPQRRQIGQYSLGGPENKRTLLTAEGLDPDRLEGFARPGIRYLGSDTTQHLLHADLPPRPAGHGQARDALRVARRRRGARGYRPARSAGPLRSPRSTSAAHECTNSPRDTHGARGRPARRRIWAGLIAVYLVWGSTYLGIRIAVETIPPFLMAGVRFLVAGAAAVRLVGRARAPHARSARRGANGAIWRSSGAVCSCGGMGFVAIGEQTVPSGIAAVLIALLPAWLAIFSRHLLRRPAAAARHRRASSSGSSGPLRWPWPADAGHLDAFGLGALILSPIFWSLGSLYSARRATLPRATVARNGDADDRGRCPADDRRHRDRRTGPARPRRGLAARRSPR